MYLVCFVLLLEYSLVDRRVMPVTNDEIVQRIKIFRMRAEKTQQDLADLLGKTAASISDLERGRVQISASDLSIIADYLQVPISGFFSDALDDKEIQEVIYTIQAQPNEARLNSFALMRLYLDIQGLSKRILAKPDQEFSPEELGEIVTKIIKFQSQYKSLTSRLDSAVENLIQVLRDNGIELPK